jgi:hypothetical protein
MRKITTFVVALGILASVSAQSQAAHYSTIAEKHALGQQRPLLRPAGSTTAGTVPNSCHYLGGPHGSSWVCS